MRYERIVAQLRRERDLLNAAIAALERLPAEAAQPAHQPADRRHSEATREKLRQGQRARRLREQAAKTRVAEGGGAPNVAPVHEGGQV